MVTKRMSEKITMTDNDDQELIYSAELALLRKVAEASSDLVKAQVWQEFREANGGIEKFEKAHVDAVSAYERCLDDGDG